MKCPRNDVNIFLTKILEVVQRAYFFLELGDEISEVCKETK